MIDAKKAERHRDFHLSVWRFHRSGDWSGMAKGLGTVVLSGGAPRPTAEAALADLRDRLDILYARGLGVFAR